MNRAEVDANHRGFGVLISHVDGPDAGACADVEDAVELEGGEFHQVEFSLEEEADSVVEGVKSARYGLG